jgi:hypothetical protein
MDGPQRPFDQRKEKKIFFVHFGKEEKLLSCPVLSLVTVTTWLSPLITWA